MNSEASLIHLSRLFNDAPMDKLFPMQVYTDTDIKLHRESEDQKRDIKKQKGAGDYNSCSRKCSFRPLFCSFRPCIVRFHYSFRCSHFPPKNVRFDHLFTRSGHHLFVSVKFLLVSRFFPFGITYARSGHALSVSITRFGALIFLPKMFVSTIYLLVQAIICSFP